ncbi:Chemoreceptor zinc-binding domain-containing protein conserved in MTBa [uncultured Gammaproteobacteria bacterium]
MMLDITHARLVHLKWASQLSRLFRNFGKDVALQTHEECAVGVWISRVGLHKYAHIEEIGQLNDCHAKFHEAASRTISCLQQKQFHQAQEAYGIVNTLSRDIVYLLTVIEYHLEMTKPH